MKEPRLASNFRRHPQMSQICESQLNGSIDSLRMRHFCSSIPTPGQLIDRGFHRKPGKLEGSTKWCHNGDIDKYEPSLTYYQVWDGSWQLRVDASIPKLLFGDNVILPDPDLIPEALSLLSDNVLLRTGRSFDAFSALVCRVDFAANLRCEGPLSRPLIEHYSRVRIPNLIRTTVETGTVYFGNKSRVIRIYDKLVEIISKNSNSPALIRKAEGIVRIEYYFPSSVAVARAVKRWGFADLSVRTVMSPECIDIAMIELTELLQLDKVDLSSGDDFRTLLAKTDGDLKKAIVMSGFKESVNALGENYYLDPKIKCSKSTYDRNRRDCRSRGISL